ncbi:TonB-dependent receptor domain-containing protein [Oceanisphaera psychrotolerans]|uniref:Vitamin B12 transporter btuB n=1 Tax=Oceanisphaera psychrotolerans TaxID=1414654 RepID=A0A1J4QGS4_9GAMM|nr:TonB-dependent receptor [Oceanisphaera psychrotolerans]OIN09593.1 vitamin B12 transporter btuB [Oceanisphaera psychrotolerans]
MSKNWLAATLLPWAAFAQNSTESTDITIYNRVEQPATSALAPVEVITKAEIERRQPRSLVDLLETLPGMQFGSQSGGIGQLSSLFVRGTESAHVLVLMNGRPMAQMVSSNVDFSQLPVSNVERIEYIRGPRAAIYGSRAIGGVVNIITTSQVNSAQVGVTTGSNDYYAADVSINQWVTDATRLQLATGYRETRGYDVIPDNSQSDRDGFDSKNLTLGIEHKLNQAWSWDTNFNGWENNTEYDYYEPYFGSPGSDSNHTEAYQVDTGIRYQDEQLTGQLNASYGEYESEDWNTESGRDTASNISTATHRLDGLVQYHYSEQGYILSGMDWQRDRLLAETTSYSAPDRDNTGVYASVFHTWSPVSVELTGRVDDNEQFGTHGTWQSALSVDLPNQHKTTLSYGTAFRAPNFIELNFLSGEPEPEKSENIELSLEGDYSLFSWQMNLYRNDIKGLLFNQTPTVKDNTDAVIEGVEFVIKTTTGPVHHTASFDYTDAEDKRAPNQGKQLLNRAKRKFSWTGDVDVARTNLFVQVLYVGERETPDAVTFERTFTPSYTIWNIGARYPLTRQLILNGKINNLFDKDYQVVDGYDAPDMEFYVGADYRF